MFKNWFHCLKKKINLASFRNRIKRLLRESYRLNKNKLKDNCIKNNFSLYLILSLNKKIFTTEKLTFDEVNSDIKNLLEKVNQIIC